MALSSAIRIAAGMLVVGRPPVVLSPHLDDAVFSCWHIVGEEKARVVTVFAGIPPAGTPLPRWDEMTGATDPATRVRERIAEDEAALGDGIRLELLDSQ